MVQAQWISVVKRILALSLVLLSSGSCAERQADGPESDLLPVCMLYPARGWDEQGDGSLILDPDGSTGRTCGCMTQEEFEQDLYLDEYNDRALQECLQLAAAFATNDCQEMYEEGAWLLWMLPATFDNAWLTIGKDLDCSEQAAEEGCSVTDDRSSPLGLLALMVVLGLARRRARTPGRSDHSNFDHTGL